MKRNLYFVLSMIAGLAISSQVFADTTPSTTMTPSATPAASAGAMMGHSHPCMNLRSACMAANPGKSKQDVWMNCIKPLVNGQSISGVNVSASDIQACKSRIMQMKQNGGWHHHNQPTQQQTTTTSSN